MAVHEELCVLLMLFWTACICVLGIAICANYAPLDASASALVRKTMQYGKILESRRDVGWQVPKRWFTHFYLLAAVAQLAVVGVLAAALGLLPCTLGGPGLLRQVAEAAASVVSSSSRSSLSSSSSSSSST